jgi:TonB family protein
MSQQAANSNAPAPGRVSVPSFTVHRQTFEGNGFTRLRDFLLERPIKLPPELEDKFTGQSFGEGLLENLKECFRGGPRVKGPVHSRMILEERGFLRGLWENVKDTIAPPKLPPLKLTSRPVPVKPIWSKDTLMPRAQVLSAAVHVLFAVLLLVPLGLQIAQNVTAAPPLKVNVSIVDISPYVPKLPPGADKAGGGGGGGERMNTPPSKGRLPKFSMNPQLTPPMATIRNPNPMLPADPTVMVPPDIRVPQPSINAFGDPLAALITGSGGPGGGGGIGTGCCGGVGSGEGPGVGPGSGGGIGGGVFRPGKGGVGYPVCLYCPDPKYSDDARKAKVQGSVLIRFVVLSDGRVTNVSVMRSLGYGLDENAIETVKGWKFKPAVGPGGKAVNVEMQVEVLFRLL